MKLYTEEQMHTVMLLALGMHGLYIDKKQNQDLIDLLTPIELPSDKEQDKFTNAPIHDKKAIIEMMNELHPKEMIEVVEFIKSKIKTYGKQ